MLERSIERLLVLYPRVLDVCRAKRPSEGVISDHQRQILAALEASEPSTLKALATRCGVTPSTMSLTVDRLVVRGSVIREVDPADRRRLSLRLSPAGRDVLRSTSLLDAECVERLLARLSPGKRRQALRGLSILARAAEGLAAGE